MVVMGLAVVIKNMILASKYASFHLIRRKQYKKFVISDKDFKSDLFLKSWEK